MLARKIIQVGLVTYKDQKYKFGGDRDKNANGVDKNKDTLPLKMHVILIEKNTENWGVLNLTSYT